MWRYKSRMAPWRKIDVIRLCKCEEFKHCEIDMSWIHTANIWCLITATYFLFSMVAVSLERTFWEMCDDMVPVRFGRTKCYFVSFITVQSCDMYMMVRLSYCHFCTLHYLIIIIMQAYLKVFSLWNTCHVHCVECVSNIQSILSIPHAIYGSVCIKFTHFPCDDCESMCT